MSSNKKIKTKKNNFKFKNEKLYTRITVTFSTMFLSLTLLTLIVAVGVCTFLLMNISKKHFEDYNMAIIKTITEHKNSILAQDESNRIDFIYENFVQPVSDTKREVSFEISDRSSRFSNEKQFERISNFASEMLYQNTSAVGKLEVKKLNFEDNIYHFLSIDIPLDNYVLHLTSYQNIQDNYIYTFILSIVILSLIHI